MSSVKEQTILTLPLQESPSPSPRRLRDSGNSLPFPASASAPDAYRFPPLPVVSSRRSSVVSLPSRASHRNSRRASYNSVNDIAAARDLATRRLSVMSDKDSRTDVDGRGSVEPLHSHPSSPIRTSGRAAAGALSSMKIWDVVLRRLRNKHFADDHTGDRAPTDYFNVKPRSQSTTSGQLDVTAGLMTPGLGGPVMSPTLESFPFGEATLLNVMDAHLSAVSNSFSRLTLTFHDPDVESTYKRYFLDRTLHMWRKFTMVAVAVTFILQIILITRYSQPRGFSTPLSDFILVGLLGIIPMVLLTLVSCTVRKDTLSKHIHSVSLLFLWLMGPIIICGRFFIWPESRYTSSLTAPLYIFVLVANVFFCRLRFVHTLVGVCLVAVPLWLVIFGIGSARNKDEGTASPISDTEFPFASVAVCLAATVICFIAYDVERNLRLQYLSDQRFLSINVKLRKQLKGLQKGFESRIADLDSPLEKAIYGLRCLMASPSVGAEDLKTLNMIMACLNAPNLLAPDLDQQVKRGQVEVDAEQEKWLFTQLAQRKNFSGDNTSESSGSVPKRPPHWVFDNTESGGAPGSSPPSPSFVPVNVEDFYTDRTVSLLVRANEYNFPIFDFVEATSQHPLLVLSHHLVVQSGLLPRLGLPVDKFLNFMHAVEAGYNPQLTFHNSIHATDVLHCIHYLISLPRIKSCFSDLEILSFYIAAAIHDYDHPGVNNHFLIATSDPRALLYNDKSVLENHHCASAFGVMRRKDCDFVRGLGKKEWRALRESIVEMVLATDLAQHFSLLAMFKKKVLTSGGFDPFTTREDRTLLMQMLMKCSDVSNPTKSWPIYATWIQRITEEFFCQGDKEKELGLPISPFCNRDGERANDPRSSQKSFIEFIVAPLVEAIGEWVELGELREGLEASRERFGGGQQPQQSKTPQATPAPQSPGGDASSGVLRRNRSVPGSLAHIDPIIIDSQDSVPPLPPLPESIMNKQRRRESWAGSIIGAGESLAAKIGVGTGKRRGSAGGISVSVVETVDEEAGGGRGALATMVAAGSYR
ncbi:uncharacterized protein SPPG_04459 [Spizellomyces punctatus DAOM BR117]|uniref:Phosphodiesterase n=1 Tax=Spizellomyces punctatus (strain DAOM BR117) TaxID=645134 RepID=A0A0L0HGH5_SPIPD|nr:uncharacterized protein SPPG_04459 [Spizellomyces punctatus DAOM BR117]KND00117.1 hypothetical protein SPPG_04459 [Spizellomyces punctatus DAOM BR117]|eukprot:XP_016608156.1 hypothetical protein SPPG_04459 [Spizellomyces punctatus DAOM BR117]